MIGTPARFTIRALLAALFFIGVVGAFGVVLPSMAGAYALIEGPPIFSSAPGLPDGRVYEQVSPVDKNGNSAGANPLQQYDSGFGGNHHFALAAPDGNSVLFEATGPIGEASAGYNTYFVARRSSGGWTTRAVTPRAQQASPEIGGIVDTLPEYLDPSPDLSHAVFYSHSGTFAVGMPEECDSQLYLSGSDPFAPAVWLDRPAIQNPVESCGAEGGEGNNRLAQVARRISARSISRIVARCCPKTPPARRTLARVFHVKVPGVFMKIGMVCCVRRGCCPMVRLTRSARCRPLPGMVARLRSMTMGTRSRPMGRALSS